MGEPFGVWGKRPAIHSTPDTRWTRCDGCRHFECTPQERSRLHPWTFYCNLMARGLEYKELFRIGIDDCPAHRRANRRERW